MAEPLAILLISGGHERAHYAFMLAAAAAAIDRPVTLFATNAGCHALRHDVSGWSAEDAAVQAAGVAGLTDLRDAALDLGARFLACESGLLLAGVESAALLAAVEITGLPTFLSDNKAAQVVTL